MGLLEGNRDRSGPSAPHQIPRLYAASGLGKHVWSLSDFYPFDAILMARARSKDGNILADGVKSFSDSFDALSANIRTETGRPLVVGAGFKPTQRLANGALAD